SIRNGRGPEPTCCSTRCWKPRRSSREPNGNERKDDRPALAPAWSKQGMREERAMSLVIKNGTIVTADRTWSADILAEAGRSAACGTDLRGGETIDARGFYVMPGGIDPHTHLEMPFMGTYSPDDFESGTRAALAGGTTLVVDFCLPSPGQSLI